jgi:hypothetical protein
MAADHSLSSEAIGDGKYAVVKLADLELIRTELAAAGDSDGAGSYALTRIEQRALPGAVVLRTHDTFASAAFTAYARAVRELLDLTTAPAFAREPSEADRARSESLDALATLFEGYAAEATAIREAGGAKIPD